MPSLILEGGTLRPIFSSGVMDALLDHDIMFPYVIGVSAGISNGVSYISKQKQRNLQIMEQFRNDPRYLGFRNYLRNRSLFGLDFVFDEIPNKHIPFDIDTYQSYDGQVLVGVTNAHTGLTEYMDGMKADRAWTMLRASCAIPLYFPAIEINGSSYYDGGISDPIPIRKAIEDGHDKHLIVLTQPKGYTKTYSRANGVAAKLLNRKYPKLAELLITRHNIYNETVAFCEQLEAEGKAVIIRPQYKLESFEKDYSKLKQSCEHGYQLAEEKIDHIRALFQ
ncbi:patatin-like phospholipase family protein [Paenibacillus sp. FSL W7-1287]|uniref:patatin-like phospholipase family protein n=1 Tax=Paenibacillus sp. FSL W7-1287 TaxID=2954538 RepID=UPI0030F80790